jgi:tetratricopeptide (TPR) repeat protein
MTWWDRLRGGARAISRADESATAADERHARLNELLETATACADRGDLGGARSALDEALVLAPQSSAVLVRSARLCRRMGSSAAALQQYDDALLQAAEPGRVHMEIGETHTEGKDLPSAIDAFTTAVTLDPRLGEAWLRLGDVYGRLDRHEDALEAFKQALDTVPEPMQAEAWFQYGQALHVLKRHAEAVQAYGECLAHDPKSVNALVACGHAELLQERDEPALSYYERALEWAVPPPPGLQLHLGTAYQYCGRWREAQGLFERVIAANPNDHLARWYLSQCDLALCNWPRGWAGYSSRFAAGASPYRPLPFRPWRGQAVRDDTLLILADQGLGDEIMFASCVTDAMTRVGHCVVECEPRLEKLFRRSFPGTTIIGSGRQLDGQWLKGLPEPQWQIFGGDLPNLFRTADVEFPEHHGYLHADPDRVNHWRRRLQTDLGPGLKAGISWRGGTRFTRTRSRSLEPQDWEPILATGGCHFINLQYGNYEPELAEINERFGHVVHDYPDALADYDETAALVAALDVVTTVCTAIVHLAGALGRPTWVLVPFSPGWRYTVKREHMPWYPSTTLFRQKAIGDWVEPTQELSAHLADLARNVT